MEYVEKIANEVIDLLMKIPEEHRLEVISLVQHNDFFCWHCGFGSKAIPRKNCQCWNDE